METETINTTGITVISSEMSTATSVLSQTETEIPFSESSIVSESNLNSLTSDISDNITDEIITEAPLIVSEQEASETTVSEIEVTTVIETEVTTISDILQSETAEVTTEMTLGEIELLPHPDNKTFSLSSYSKYIVIGAILIAGIIYLLCSKGKKNNTAENSARKKDQERINKAAKKSAKKNPKKSKDKTKAAKSSVPKNVHDTMPYQKVLSNNIWLIAPKTYSKAYIFSDINYNLGDEQQQFDCLENYCNYLNTLDDTIDCQVTMFNHSINISDLEKELLIKDVDDGYQPLRQEYNTRILKENISKGQNAIQKKLYITLTIKTADEEYAQNKFKILDLELRNSFDRVGNTGLRVLTSQERVEMLKDIFIDSSVKIPELTEKDYKNKLDKVYCSPDYFEFKSDYFMFNNTFAKVIFIKEYPSRANDSILTDLMNTNLKIIVTTNIIAHDPAKARKLVQRQITAIETNMAQRESKAAQHGNFSSQMPVRIKTQIDGYKKLYDKLTVDDQKLFSCNTIIMIMAESYDELISNVDIISSTLKRNGAMYGEMKYQQEDGMIDCLPCGSQRRFTWRRSLPTESVAIFQPFNVKEIQQHDSIYYGLNVLSNNLITFNKLRSLINPSGFILGCPGSGKSFSAKREMMDVFMRYPDADILIIDPEREYPAIVEMFGGASVKISSGSQNFINPFEYDESLLNDPEVDVIADKCQLITSFISVMDSKELNAQECSFIDRCVRKTYIYAAENNITPTLGTFRDVMKDEVDVKESIKEKLLMTIEMYVDGSAKYFNNITNVDVNNRMISYDIKDLSGTLKTQAMLLVLDYIWNRLSKNRDNGRSTWIYVDEIYLLFENIYCLTFLKQLYKRARKYGGVITGITQNVEDLLKNNECRTMLSNSEFLLLLKQAPADIIKLQDTLKFTDSEVFYVSNVKAGQGLMILGGKDKIPFYDEFPRDTELYRKISTSFTEMADLKRKKTDE